MKLGIKPSHKNTHPLNGILIKSNQLEDWLRCLTALEINLQNTPVYAIPATVPNSIWGCFVLFEKKSTNGFQNNLIEYCQEIHNKLFIPEFSTIFPQINPTELTQFFKHHPHVYHPEFGLFELESPIDWESLLEVPIQQGYEITAPVPAPFIPKTIQKIEIKPLPAEKSIKEMEEKMFPKKETLKDKPLSPIEKVKLKLLNRAFEKSKDKSKDAKIEKRSWLKKMLPYLGGDDSKLTNYVEKKEQDFEDLERRNSSEMEKLMDLFKNNPEEALKYAIPIDFNNSGRGGNQGAFTMAKRWQSMSLFGNEGNYRSGGSATVFDDSMYKLQQQYFQAATNFINEGKYEKAAFVYMKLLQNNQLAAETLEKGKLYSEAASVYLKLLNNKLKAANCYENGRMTSEAIELYKELQMNEKVGDLYSSIHNRTEADRHYNFVVEEYKNLDQYVKASMILKNKMNDKQTAQPLLLKGWREKKDGLNCLNNYFNNIEDLQHLSKEINKIYSTETDETNKENFLYALKLEHSKHKDLHVQTRQIGYEIIAELAPKNRYIVSELSFFNPDVQLSKDIIRFKTFPNSNL